MISPLHQSTHKKNIKLLPQVSNSAPFKTCHSGEDILVPRNEDPYVDYINGAVVGHSIRIGGYDISFTGTLDSNEIIGTYSNIPLAPGSSCAIMNPKVTFEIKSFMTLPRKYQAILLASRRGRCQLCSLRPSLILQKMGR